MAREVVSLTQARDSKATHYFTGVPCKYGHVALRHTSSRACTVCASIKVSEAYKSNPARFIRPLEKDREASRRYRERHPERRRESSRRWARNNPEVGLAALHRRRANKLKSGGSFTQKQILDLLEKQNYLCFYCNADITTGYQRDHYFPLAKGGSNYIDNIRMCCRPCNLSKGDNLPHEWAPKFIL